MTKRGRLSRKLIRVRIARAKATGNIPDRDGFVYSRKTKIRHIGRDFVMSLKHRLSKWAHGGNVGFSDREKQSKRYRTANYKRHWKLLETLVTAQVLNLIKPEQLIKVAVDPLINYSHIIKVVEQLERASTSTPEVDE